VINCIKPRIYTDTELHTHQVHPRPLLEADLHGVAVGRNRVEVLQLVHQRIQLATTRSALNEKALRINHVGNNGLDQGLPDVIDCKSSIIPHARPTK
jgi:hypothetical protein